MLLTIQTHLTTINQIFNPKVKKVTYFCTNLPVYSEYVNTSEFVKFIGEVISTLSSGICDLNRR